MKNWYLFFALLPVAYSASAQLSIPTIGSPVTIDFSGYTGAGFQPGGGGGTLNSNEWVARGFSDGEVTFGGTSTTGDFARGSTMGLVTTGGIYGVDIAGNQGLMVQPTADDFTPGYFVLKLQNNTGEAISEIDLAYTIYVLNDQGRSNSFNFAYSYDDVTYTNVTDLDYVSPEAGDFTPYVTNQSFTLTGLSINDGDVFYFEWWGDDVSGAGNRDEFALDDISITPVGGVVLPVVSFLSPGELVDESVGTETTELIISQTADCDVTVNASLASTADGSDYTLTLPATYSFTDGGPLSINIDIPIVDDALIEADETLILQITGVSGTCVTGLPNQYSLIIQDNDPGVVPLVDIEDVTGIDADGVCTHVGEVVQLEGVVYGINLRTGGLQFTLIDPTDGISVFSFTDTFGYTVAEGDKVKVTGTITQFNGLTEIEPDTIEFVSAANPLKTPTATTALGEPAESDLIEFDFTGSHVHDPSQWLGDGSSFNVDIMDGVGNITQIRIDDNTELSTMAFSEVFPGGPAPLTFIVRGLGTQFDASSPYTEGYQLMPRYLADFNIEYLGVDQITPALCNIYPVPVSDVLHVDAKILLDHAAIFDAAGNQVKAIALHALDNSISVQDLPAGTYIIKVFGEDTAYAGHFIKL
ncbi:MAG: T9SS type A sorting domain-containing protein [Chitinophagales bacterium]